MFFVIEGFDLSLSLSLSFFFGGLAVRRSPL